MPDGPGGFTQDYSCPALLRSAQTQNTTYVRGCHPLRRNFPEPSVICVQDIKVHPTTPDMHKAHARFGLFPGRSPLLGESLLFSLPPGTKMFQFPGLAPCIQYRVTVLQTDGLSHSEIRASRDICSYTRLIAAYHVLHRLCEPRHPPYALTLLRHKNSQHTPQV